jgi:hypothetical protein
LETRSARIVAGASVSEITFGPFLRYRLPKNLQQSFKMTVLWKFDPPPNIQHEQLPPNVISFSRHA